MKLFGACCTTSTMIRLSPSPFIHLTVIDRWTAEQPRLSKNICSKVQSSLLKKCPIDARYFLMLLLFFLSPIYTIQVSFESTFVEQCNLPKFLGWINSIVDIFNCSCRCVRRNELDAGFPIFESESLKWPGFVEFDSVNGKALIYAAQEGYAFFSSSFFSPQPYWPNCHSFMCSIYKVFDLENYSFLYSIQAANVHDIKIRFALLSPDLIYLTVF